MDLKLAIYAEAERKPEQKAIRHAHQIKFKKLYHLQISAEEHSDLQL